MFVWLVLACCLFVFVRLRDGLLLVVGLRVVRFVWLIDCLFDLLVCLFACSLIRLFFYCLFDCVFVCCVVALLFACLLL